MYHLNQFQILLVEKGTCFALWKDVIDNLSKYTSQVLIPDPI